MKILIPTPLRQYTGNKPAVEVAGATVSEALKELTERHTGIARHLLDDAGSLRSFVNVYVNDEDIRHLEQGNTALASSDVITIVPSVAGGGSWPS